MQEHPISLQAQGTPPYLQPREALLQPCFAKLDPDSQFNWNLAGICQSPLALHLWVSRGGPFHR